MSDKPILLGRTPDELTELVLDLGEPKYRAKQLTEWLYPKRASSFEEMTNLPKAFRDKLDEKFRIGRSEKIAGQTSVDGTEKYLYRPILEDELFFETVYIPEEDRATLCVSSQVGCKMNCLFCATGKMGFLSQLTPADVLNQILSAPHFDRLTNIVFMGMGEPLDNYDTVARTIEILTAPWGLAWSPKRITVSTVGPKKGLLKFLREQSAHLAVSIHNAIPRERLALMPVEKAFPIKEVIDNLKGTDFSGQRRLSFEYIVFGGLNDTKVHADALLRLLSPLDARVNLIRYHAIPGVDLPSSRPDQVDRFAEYLTAHGLRTTVRRSRGEDISAACGMLATEERKSRTDQK